METLYEESYFYAVLRDEKTGEYFLEVTCGTSSLFDVRIKLKKAEIESFERERTALGVLAAKILDAPQEYVRRRRI